MIPLQKMDGFIAMCLAHWHKELKMSWLSLGNYWGIYLLVQCERVCGILYERPHLCLEMLQLFGKNLLVGWISDCSSVISLFA